jgi:diaminohydroxyphosphoribosylaminopyrimidine deaminase/5-amino-6-(5-phosphoribosylamino)uracil reductase
MLSHKLRAEEDAILVGRVTNEREHPQLNVRHWYGQAPKRLVIDHQHPLNMESLYAHNIQSLIVEGGATTLQSFIDKDLWDEIRVETAPITVGDGTRAPQVPGSARIECQQAYDGHTISTFMHCQTLS